MEAGSLSARDLERALHAQQEMGGLLGQVLIRLGVVSEQELARHLADQLALPLLQASDYPDVPVALEGLSIDFLLAHQVVPLAVAQGRLRVGMTVPQDEFTCRGLFLATGLEVEPCLGLESELVAALQRLYVESDTDAQEETGETDSLLGNDFVDYLKDLASEAPVIRLVNQIIAQAIDLRASDIHIEPYDDRLAVRYRIDGVLQESESPPVSLAPAVTSRIKLLAHLNIAERRLPQDGRIRTRVKGHELDLRVSTVPTVHGESVVMRVLDRASVRFGLEEMGFSADTLERFNELLTRPHGILLVTGPTGSGKTTTLYAALAKIDAVSLKILTVEDPVEYQLPGINQIQVQPQIGLSFAHALRSILRQDPDIIMIGEMRDTETAQIAVQSALTGHLVLSTLHTNDAPTAITRLLDLGVPPYLLQSTVIGVMAQRLVRTLCPHCKKAGGLRAEDEALWHGLVSPWKSKKPAQLYHPAGCLECRMTGYMGRLGLYEIMPMAAELKGLIGAHTDLVQLRERAIKAGMQPLRIAGARKVAAGLTTMEEVFKVAPPLQELVPIPQ